MNKRKDGILTILLTGVLSIFFCGCSGETHQHEHDNDLEDHEDHTTEIGIHISEEQAQKFGIVTEKIVPGEFHDVIKTSGMIESTGSDAVTISAKKSGIFRLSPHITSGVELKANEMIGSISTQGLQGGDASQAAHVNLQAAKAEYERLKTLYEEKLVTASTFKEAERTYHEARALTGSHPSGTSIGVVSPQKGVLQSLYASNGEYVEVGTPIALVASNTQQVLRADVPARYNSHIPEIESANFVAAGTSKTLSIKDLDGEKISGNQHISSSNGYVPVYFSFSGNALFTPSGYAEVYLLCSSRNGVLSVPKESILEIQGEKYLYVSLDEDNDHFEKRLVKTGASDGNRVEILQGISPGETIVSKGASVVRMTEISAVAPPSHTHNH